MKSIAKLNSTLEGDKSCGEWVLGKQKREWLERPV
jgi:hypothetical protein